MSAAIKRWCLTGAEAAASSDVLPPSTRVFGRVPLTGKVNKPRRKERAPVVQEVDANERSASQQPHCEIGKIRKAEGECLRPGEVQLNGSVLCVRHAKLLGLMDHSEIMLGEKFEMDQWLESIDGQTDELRIRRAEHHRDDLVEEIRSDRGLGKLIRDELGKNRDGTT